MQSGRRHELETNALADAVARVTDRIRPHLGTIGIAAAALVVALASWSLVDARRTAAREESWDACIGALSNGQATAIDAVAARYPGTPAAQWARLVLADGMLDQGSQALFTDRAVAEQRLQAAAATYTGLLAENPIGFVAERASFGLAKARESLGSLDEAVRGYEALVREHPGSAVRPFAEERIAALGRQSTRQWYDWFAQQKPAPPAKADGAAATTPDAGSDGAERPAAAGTGTDAPG